MRLMRPIGVALVLSLLAQGCATVRDKKIAKKKHIRDSVNYNESFALWDEGTSPKSNTDLKKISDY